MLGAVIGDIVGSRFEWNNYRAKDFEFLTFASNVSNVCEKRTRQCWGF